MDNCVPDQLQPNTLKRPVMQTTNIRLTKAGIDVKINFLSRNCNPDFQDLLHKPKLR